MKKIMLLLLATSSLLAMELEHDSSETLESKVEVQEGNYTMNQLKQSELEIAELNFLLAHGDSLRFELKDKWHQWNAFVAVSTRRIYNRHIKRFSPEEQEQMKKYIAKSKAEDEERRKYAEEQQASPK